MRNDRILTFSVLFIKFNIGVGINWLEKICDSLNIGPSLMHLTSMHKDSDVGDNQVQENNDADDDFDVSDNILQDNIMQVAVQDVKDDTERVENAYTNSEYVMLEDPHPDEFQDNGWVNSTYVENITAEFNRCTTPIASEDLKIVDIFESKVKLFQAIIE